MLYYKESWAPKNWCLWTVVLEKTLEILLECKEIQPVHLKEISPGYSLEGLMLKLKLQYFGHLMRRADMGLGGLRELVMDREAWRAAVHGVAKSRTWLSDWTELNSLLFTAICKASSDNYFAFLYFLLLGMVLIPASCTMPRTSPIILQALCLSDLIPWIYLSVPLYNRKGFDLVHTWMV